MSTRDHNRCVSTMLPLAAALALTASGALPAATLLRPGEMQGLGVAIREDGTPLRTTLRAWHQDAVRNASPDAPSATLRYVTNCDDDGAGSLRAVVAMSVSGDTVDLGALSCSVISLETGGIAVALDTLTVNGSRTHRIAVNGNNISRVFLHYGGGTLTLRDLTIRNGYDHASGTHVGVGGCIASAGYLTLDRSTVTDCYAAGEGAYGGGIYAYSLSMASSTLSHGVAYGTHPTNNTAAFGGGAFVYQIDLVQSTISANTARHRVDPPRTSYDIGGGIGVVHGGLVIDSTIDGNYSFGRGGGLATFDSVTIRNSTISGNTALTSAGGGLFLRFPADLAMLNSTVTANHGRKAGGLYISPHDAQMQSSIVAGNTADIGAADLASARVTTIAGANNLIGTVAANVTIPADSVSGDPGLLPLASNGGPTRTHALREDSAAIDAGNNAVHLTTDQRGEGFARVVGAAPDIGAFEFNASVAAAQALQVPALSNWAFATLLMLCGWFGLRASRTQVGRDFSRGETERMRERCKESTQRNVDAKQWSRTVVP